MYSICSCSDYLSWCLFISRGAKRLNALPKPDKAIWEKIPSAFLGLEKPACSGLHLFHIQLGGRLNLRNPVIKNQQRKQYYFLFCFVHFQLFKKPSNSLPTTWQRENRFIVFIWNHVSSLPFAQKYIFFNAYSSFIIQLHLRAYK